MENYSGVGNGLGQDRKPLLWLKDFKSILILKYSLLFSCVKNKNVGLINKEWGKLRKKEQRKEEEYISRYD